MCEGRWCVKEVVCEGRWCVREGSLLSNVRCVRKGSV